VSYPTVAEIIAQVESGTSGGVRAIRFEADLFEKIRKPENRSAAQNLCIKKIAKINQCSGDTAMEIFCTSYGKFQILGETLYSTLQYQKPVQVFFADVTEQEAAFQTFLKIHSFTYPGESLLSDATLRETFARFYNGPGNVSDYCERIVEAGAFLMK